MGLLLGVIVGLVLALTGAGGTILAVQKLMAVMAGPKCEAVPVALLAVAASAALGSYLAWRISYVLYRAAMRMSVAGVLTALFGLHVADVLPQRWVLLAFASTLAV